MPLIDATLQAALEAIDAEAQAAPMSSAVYNAKIAKAHSDFIKTATVNVVSVSGVLSGGATSGPGTGTLS